MIIIISTIKYGSTYYHNTFTMGVCSNYHGYFFQFSIYLIPKKNCGFI